MKLFKNFFSKVKDARIEWKHAVHTFSFLFLIIFSINLVNAFGFTTQTGLDRLTTPISSNTNTGGNITYNIYQINATYNITNNITTIYNITNNITTYVNTTIENNITTIYNITNNITGSGNISGYLAENAILYATGTNTIASLPGFQKLLSMIAASGNDKGFYSANTGNSLIAYLVGGKLTLQGGSATPQTDIYSDGNGNVVTTNNFTADCFSFIDNSVQCSAWLGQSYNATYETCLNNVSYLSTYNVTYAGLINNVSYLSTFNASYEGSLNNISYLSTYNVTYAGLMNNLSYLSTYNSTYDKWAYNQTSPALTYADTKAATSYLHNHSLQNLTGVTSSVCSGTDKVTNVTMRDGVIVVVCTADLGAIPAGMISPFYLAACPTGWTIADGTVGTPDLRDRFIVASGTTYAYNSTGGSTTYTPAGTITMGHNHNYTDVPNHIHNQSYNSASTGGASSYTVDTSSSGSSTVTFVQTQNPVGGVAVGWTKAANGTDTFAGNQATIIPPYHSLIYCMKT